MGIYDYHRRVLCPEIWSSDEMQLRRRTRTQLDQQLRSRFPAVKRVFLVGDLAGHYYNEASELDLILLVPANLVQEYRSEAQMVSGYNLKGTEHAVYFYILPDTTKPETLAEKFGPVYDFVSLDWIGKREHGLTEFANPNSVLQYVKWRLYKAKNWEDPYPYEWEMLPQVLDYLSDDQRDKILQELRENKSRLRHNITDVLESYRDPSVWKAADKLDQLLEADADLDDIDEFVVASKLPKPVVLAIYNVYRFDDVINIIEEFDEKIKKRNRDDWDQTGIKLQLSASTKTASGSEEYMKERLLHLVDQIIMANGGHHNAVETMYDICKMLIRRSRYLTMRSQRLSIALRLYRKFTK